MKRNAIAHNLDGLAALLLFAVFAASVMAVLLTGAKDGATLRFYERAGYNCNDKTVFVQWL